MIDIEYPSLECIILMAKGLHRGRTRGKQVHVMMDTVGMVWYGGTIP